MQIKGALLAVATLLFAACASYDPYIPEERATATLSGRTAASYSVPSDLNPQGQVRVASAGISELEQERTGEKTKAVHVRLAVANNGTMGIGVDVREQRIQLQDGTQIAPVFARSAAGNVPVIVVPPASSRVLDLLFPIPEQGDEKQPPRFDVVWRVRVGDTPVLQVTPFNEVEVDPAIAEQEALEDGYYGPYWYDPMWGPGRWWWY